MSTEILFLREGTTDDIQFVLSADGVVIDLVGVNHVVLFMRDCFNKVYKYSSDDTSPVFTIYDAANGEVQFTPPNSDVFEYNRTPYKIYVWIYTSATKKYSVPDKGYAQINVEKAF